MTAKPGMAGAMVGARLTIGPLLVGTVAAPTAGVEDSADFGEHQLSAFSGAGRR